ncbi:DUF3592 domain-containing protein [Streptomyces sp. W16]|uniref:DUF3592 domain-containing protein n=1 Tax=Streptomyces sp. W16 TaxID=3076631 RepID=UPI00295BDCAB|nr:DUF3592 domain-containing protein [Streptomyces sp. W16]MDV9177248.1 DUF3592 domain-containing protein [Streptomyces sp. W16]
MTTTPSPSSIVLRGRDATARFEEGLDHVLWEQDGRTVRIPLAAIEDVRGADRTAEIVLTTARAGRSGAVYAVHDTSAAAVSAFGAAVRARLTERAPLDPRPEGEDLVTITDAPASASARGPWWSSRRVLSVLAVIAVFVVIDVMVGVRGGSEFVAVLPFVQLFTAVGVLLVAVMGRGLHDGRRLPRHGITVSAEFDHYTNNTRVYRYTDLDGGVHHYRDSTGGERLELSYDPRDPGRAAARLSPYMQFMMALMTLVGLALTCGGLWLTGHELVVSLRG